MIPPLCAFFRKYSLTSPGYVLTFTMKNQGISRPLLQLLLLLLLPVNIFVDPGQDMLKLSRGQHKLLVHILVRSVCLGTSPSRKKSYTQMFCPF